MLVPGVVLLFMAQLSTFPTLYLPSVFAPGSDVVRFITFRTLFRCTPSCVDRRRDTTRHSLSSRCMSSRVASCVTSRSVDRRKYRCLCWCWWLSLCGIGSRLMARVVDSRVLSSTRIADRRVLACRCRFTVFRDVCLGSDRFDNTLSTPLADKWMPSA